MSMLFSIDQALAGAGQAVAGQKQKSSYWVNIGTMSPEGVFISNFGVPFDKNIDSNKKLNGSLALQFKTLQPGEAIVTELGKGVFMELRYIDVNAKFDEADKMDLF